MVRRALPALTCLILCGCAHSRFVEHPITSWFTPAPAASAPTATDIADARCRKLAQQRRRDASFQGEDDDTLREVYDRTYAACLVWDTAHRPPPL